MENLKKIVSDYCKMYVTTDHDAKWFMEYYDPNFYDTYSDHIEDKESFDYLDFLHTFINDTSYIENIVADLYEFYNTNKPY